MTKTADAPLHAKFRLRQEIVEATQALRKAGAISLEKLEKTTIRMFGKGAQIAIAAMPGKRGPQRL